MTCLTLNWTITWCFATRRREALEWVREVHSKIITDSTPIVIIHDNPDEIDLPDKQDEPAFNDVYIVKGDPTNEVILNLAKVSEAHSIVILSDAREGKHADGKSILTCIAVRHACRKEHQPNIVVELHNSSNRFHLLQAGASEIVSSDSLGLRLLALGGCFHGMTQFYQELLTVRRDANEVYLLPAPRRFWSGTASQSSTRCSCDTEATAVPAC